MGNIITPEKQFEYSMKPIDSTLKKIADLLITESENLWKVLYYPEIKNSLDSLPNLSNYEKSKMVYSDLSQLDGTESGIFYYPFTTGEITKANTIQIRIYDGGQYLEGVRINNMVIGIDILVYHKLSTINDTEYLLRTTVIKEELKEVLNQIKMNSVVGNLSFDGRWVKKKDWGNGYYGYQMYLRGVT